MEETNLLTLSRADELSVRKVILQRYLEEVKKTLEDKVMLMLVGSFDKNTELKLTGTVVFYEKWIDEINKEIKEI